MNKKYKLLSYPLNEKVALYGGDTTFQIKKRKQIRNGDSCNTFELNFMNHSGTHIDAPFHFYNSGRSIGEYGIGELIFSKPFVLHCSKKQNELIIKEDLLCLRRCDILLIKTSFFRYRQRKRYIFHNPGISAQAADFIRQKHPYVRAIGIDTISISSYQNRQEGRQAHRIFLKKRGYSTGPVVLVEDMDLSGSLGNLKKVYVMPLFVEKIDSAPCTVIGEF